jgi:hypothetical protein
VGVKTFDFDALAVGAGHYRDVAIGEDAIDVEEEDFDTVGACGVIERHDQNDTAASTHDALAAVVCGNALAPAAFDPDVAIVTMLPAAVDPACVGMWRGNVFAGRPDVRVAVPAVITVAPNPVAVFGGDSRAGFNDACGRADADDNLRACHERCGKYETANGGQ